MIYKAEASNENAVGSIPYAAAVHTCLIIRALVYDSEGHPVAEF